MKNLPKIIGLVFGIVILILAGVFVYESMIRAPKAAEKASVIRSYTLPKYGGEAGQPKSSFPASGSGEEQAPVSDDINGIQQQLEQTQSIDTSTDLQDLQTEAQGL